MNHRPIRHSCITVFIATAVLNFAFDGSANAANGEAETGEAAKWGAYIELLGSLGSDNPFGQADMFVPLAQNQDSLLFLNLRGNVDFHNKSEFNIGLGYRHQFDNWILGGYGYFDQHMGENDNIYRQATFGLEALGEGWDLRVNGYLPEDDPNATGGTVLIDDDQISVQAFAENSMRGFDGEIGLRLPVADWFKVSKPETRAFFDDVRVYVGGYHFFRDDYESISGPRLRLEWGFDDLPALRDGARLTLGLQTQYDEPRGSSTEGMLRLRIPLGNGNDEQTETGSALTELDQRMIIPVVRDRDVVIGEASRQVAALNPAGDAYQRYLEYTSRDSMETGTDHVSGDRNSADEVILVNMQGGEDDATNWEMTDFTTAGNGVSYTRASTDTPIWFDNPLTGTREQTSFLPDGPTPELAFDESTSSSLASMFSLLAGDHINGWHLDATGFNNGLLLDATGQYYLTHTEIENSKGRGINVKSGGKLYANWVDVHDNKGTGVWAQGAGSEIVIKESNSSDNGQHGLSAAGGGKIVASGMIIERNSQVGADAHGNNSFLEITDSLVAYNGSEGVIANFGATTVASGLVVTHNDDVGVSSFGGILTISDSIISYNDGDGVYSEALNGKVSNDGEVVRNYFDDYAELTMTNVQIFGNSGYGILNRGSRMTVSDANVYDNLTGEILNQSGVATYSRLNPHCIRNDGFLIVDGVLIAPVEVTPIPAGSFCTATP